ncbi:MAG: hypothetical protein WKG32_20465, partial [Gemmatimonadaceae bacterium]
MSDDRVRELQLTVRAPPGADEALASRAEGFTRRALERASALIEERAPGRLVVVRRLPLRWRLAAGALDTPAAEQRCAESIAQALLDVPVATGPEALGEDVAAFGNAAHRWALRLEARAGHVRERESAVAEEEDVVRALCDPARSEELLAALERLARADLLEGTLDALPDDDVLRLAAGVRQVAMSRTAPAAPE